MVAAVAARTAAGTISSPPGWTLIRRDMSGNMGAELSQALYFRISSSREPSSYVWSFASPVSANGAILAYGGANRRHPIDSHGGRYTPDATDFAAPSIRTSTRGDRLLAFFSSTGTGGITPPEHMRERFDLVGDDLELEGAAAVVASAGATGVRRAANSTQTTTSSSFGQLLALRPACSGATGRPRVGQRPAILGSAYVGRRLATYTGAWCGKRPMRFTYRWQRCSLKECATIRGATGATYTPTKRDIDRSLTFRVTARSTSGTTTVKSNAKQIGRTRPTNTSPPTISGTAEEGFALTASTGSWTGLEPMTYAYQWRRCDASGSGCTSVSGANSSTYVLASADVAETMRVVITAKNSSGSKSTTSSQTAVVAPAASAATAPSNTTLPAVSGSASQGSTLSGSSGAWSGTVPISYAYQWQRCDSGGSNCSSVGGASGQTYLLGAGDIGWTLRLLITASNSAGSSSAASLSTAVVAASATPPLNSTPPSTAGTAAVGSLLSASTGTWTGTTPIGYTYQWRRCDQAGANCVSIPGATGAGYQVSYADGGSALRILVTAVNAVGSNVATSAQTGVVPSIYPTSYFSGPAGANNILPPTGRGAFLGLWDNVLTQAFDREAVFGRKLDLLGAMYNAPRGGCYNTVPFSDGKPQQIVKHGAIPIVHYRPGFTLDEINAGNADECFRDLGRRVHDFGYPVFLRIYHEFNGTWMPYSGCGDTFISAWRRTVSLVRAAGASNAVWVWNPAEGYRDCAFSSYPGDAWVDWVAVDGYNRNTGWCGNTQGWCEFWQLFRFDPRVSLHEVYGPRKPFAVFETGSVEDAFKPGRKGQWHLNALASIKNEFPYLKAFVYSDFDTSSSGGPNWRLDTSQSSLDGFSTLARDPYFNTR
jgi:Glycosyl hydrolase family 26